MSKTYPTCAAVHGTEKYILLIGETAGMAQERLASIKKELESNPLLLRDYPAACGIGPKWNEGRIETRNGVCLEAIGAGSAIRGRMYGPHRPTMIVVDDLENDESVLSSDQRTKMWKWFASALMESVSPTTNIFCVGTALHPKDTLQCLKTAPGWSHKTFRALIQEPLRMDLWDEWQAIYRDVLVETPVREREAWQFYLSHKADMDDGAEVLWPSREPLYLLMCKRAFDREAFESEKQSRPSSVRNSIFHPDYFPIGLSFRDWPQMACKVLSLDSSLGKSETSDYSAITAVGLGLNDNRLYVDADIARRDPLTIASDLCDFAAWFQPHGVALETNGFQALMQPLIERECLNRHMTFAIYPVVNTMDKVLRVRRLTPYLRDGRFRFKSGSRSVEMLLDQMKEFPTGDFDDGPDSLEQGVRLLEYLTGAEQEAA